MPERRAAPAASAPSGPLPPFGPPGRPGGPGPGPWLGPKQKAKNIKGTLLRLWGYLRMQGTGLLLVSLLVVVTTAITTIIVNAFCGRKPRSKPMFSTISSMSARVFISVPSMQAS